MKMDNRGSTLVEITAGFLMLVVVMASFIKIINLSSEMTETAVDMKKNNLEFDQKYFTGYNYDVNGESAFRSGSDEIVVFTEGGASVPLKLIEWHKLSGSDYYEEWHESNGKFVQSTPTNARVFELSNIKLYHIENVRDKTIAKGNIYRYKYSVTP